MNHAMQNAMRAERLRRDAARREREQRDRFVASINARDTRIVLFHQPGKFRLAVRIEIGWKHHTVFIPETDLQD